MNFTCDEISTLTKCERETLQAVIDGSGELTNKQIAAKMFVSSRTVEFHLQGAREKLGCKRTSGMLAKILKCREGSPPG